MQPFPSLNGSVLKWNIRFGYGGETQPQTTPTKPAPVRPPLLPPSNLLFLIALRGQLANEYKVPAGERIEDFNPIINTMALVATLIATVTFAAAFTMPGRYDTSPNNLGVANLAKKALQRAFILSDTIAMLFSIIAVLALALAVYFEQEMQRRICLISWALINLTMRGSLVAFMSGLFVVTAPKALWEAISVCIICCTVTLASLELSVPFLFFPSIRDLLLIFRQKMHQWLKDLREFTSRRSSSMA